MADADALINRCIEPDPHHPGPADVRLKDSGVHVWAIIGDYLYVSNQDANAVATGYEISVEAVLAAIAYYRRQQPVIDARLAANSSSVP